MEEVDRILIHSLRQTGTEVPEDVECVKQFSTELIVEAVVRCLRVINPSVGNGINHLLPPGMSARFRIGMSLAQACQDLGYQGEVGYQTFLYSSEPEIRRLLMFLVEKLPRESSEMEDQPAGKSAALQKAISVKIKEQLSIPWVHPSCRIPLLLRTQSTCHMMRFHAQPLALASNTTSSVKKISKELKEYYDNYLPPVTVQPSQHSFLPASVLERNMVDLSAVQEWETEWNNQGLVSRLSPEDYRSRKCQRLQKRIKDQLRNYTQQYVESQNMSNSASDLLDVLKSYSVAGDDILTKGSRFTHTERFTFSREHEQLVSQMQTAAENLPSTKKSEQDMQAQQQEEVTSLHQQLDQLTVKIQQLGVEMKSLTLNLSQIEDEMKQKELTASEKEDSIKVKKRTVDLLPDAENNLTKLQAVVESSAQRVVNLASQWEKHRVPLIEEYRKLKELKEDQELKSSHQLSQIKELHEKIKQAAEDSKRKDGLYKQLLSEYEGLPKDVSRSAYTQRILEIVGNIKKQKEEITKILSDTRSLQKEINHLTGKLDRTFAVTDELVFKDAKRDEAVRKAYKYLAALHENCTQLIQTIEDTGTIMREIRDLEEQIETENGKKTLSNLEKILDDYKAIKQENLVLVAKIRET
ncbi:coiled-coil domain-containing protein 22 [Protopterus annectens]|uniref:coiled-coil domain-containing protein 22 n=1 Tax=Protopterus annectens TaxID=7888 RepID=UPI001CF93D32|nr:coiled-coil domain-containing protein 22 [Protopterus annectens]